MNGRLENDMKLFAKAEKKLTEMPSFVTDWYRYMQASYITAATCRDYVFKVALFLSSINKDLKKITASDITEGSVVTYMFSIKTKMKDGKQVETSDSYRNTVWYALNSFLQYLTDHKLIEENYVLKIKKKKNTDLERINQHRVKLTADDFNKMLNSIDAVSSRYPERDKAILMLYMSTGMRKTALSSINIEDIDLQNKRLTVIDKGDKKQFYKLYDKELKAITDWMEKRKWFRNANETSALFISNVGNRISEAELERMIKDRSKKALGKSFSPHKLRAGFVTIMYEQTHDIEKVRRMVGHSNATTTQRYIVTDNQEKEEAAEIMENLLT